MVMVNKVCGVRGGLNQKIKENKRRETYNKQTWNFNFGIKTKNENSK
jgi:hypothetical protein